MAHYKSLPIFLFLFLSTFFSIAAAEIDDGALPGAPAAGVNRPVRHPLLPQQDNRVIEALLLPNPDLGNAAAVINR
jgi:hypothetical protein